MNQLKFLMNYSKTLLKKDDEFTGIIVNIHNEKKIINKEELKRL